MRGTVSQDLMCPVTPQGHHFMLVGGGHCVGYGWYHQLPGLLADWGAPPGASANHIPQQPLPLSDHSPIQTPKCPAEDEEPLSRCPPT